MECIDGAVPLHAELDGPWWDDGLIEKECARALTEAYFVRRERAVVNSGGYLVSMGILVVDPAYHGYGIGKTLMQWGFDLVDMHSIETIVEAFRAGVPPYEAFGFVTKEVVTVEPLEQ